MNSGWYHTSKVNKPFGFDFLINLNTSFAPEKYEMFKFADLRLNSVTSSAATVIGSKNQKSMASVSFQEGGNTYETQFTMPGEIKEDFPLRGVLTLIVQISLCLPNKFDASLPLVPKVGSKDIKGSLFGLGVKKEITSWFDPIEKTPLYVSLLASYTSMIVDYNIQNGSSISGLIKLQNLNYTYTLYKHWLL